VYSRFQYEFNPIVVGASDKDTILATMSDRPSRVPRDWYAAAKAIDPHAVTRDLSAYRTRNGEVLARRLLLMYRRRPDEIWKTLARVWVQLLVYAAPYGNAEAHTRRLSQGGEFITHLWALLYHLDIRRWKVEGNLAEITTSEDAERVLAEDDQAVVALVFDDHVSAVPFSLLTTFIITITVVVDIL
jgi:hypothetical protein